METQKTQENHYNQMEIQMLTQFRKKIDDVVRAEDTDATLLKWLRGNNYNLNKCEARYREYIAIRDVGKVDNHNEWDLPEALIKYEFASIYGFAKDGTPIRYVAMGRGDIRGFIMSADCYDIAKYCSNINEEDKQLCREQSLKVKREIHQITYIIDMEGFCLRTMLHQCILEVAWDLFRMLQEYYPEIWKHIFVVNAPPYFHTFFNTIKPILGHNLLKNISVVSREQTAGLLLKYIDADVLPAFLGGKRVDSQGNPMCSEFTKFGGTIPEEYYMRNKSPLLPSDVGAAEVWIPSRGTFNYSFVVREGGSMARIEFRTQCGSVNNCTLFRDLKDPENPDLPGPHEHLDHTKEKCNAVLIAPIIRCQTHLSPVDNFLFLPKPGIYIFVFDNSCNWLTSRRLIYRIRVIPPEKVPCLAKCKAV